MQIDSRLTDIDVHSMNNYIFDISQRLNRRPYPKNFNHPNEHLVLFMNSEFKIIGLLPPNNQNTIPEAATLLDILRSVSV